MIFGWLSLFSEGTQCNCILRGELSFLCLPFYTLRRNSPFQCWSSSQREWWISLLQCNEERKCPHVASLKGQIQYLEAMSMCMNLPIRLNGNSNLYEIMINHQLINIFWKCMDCLNLIALLFHNSHTSGIVMIYSILWMDSFTKAVITYCYSVNPIQVSGVQGVSDWIVQLCFNSYLAGILNFTENKNCLPCICGI